MTSLNMDMPPPLDLGPLDAEQLAEAVRALWEQRPKVYVITAPDEADRRFAQLIDNLTPNDSTGRDRSVRTEAGSVRIITTNQANQLRGPIGRFIIDHGALDDLDTEKADLIRSSAMLASR